MTEPVPAEVRVRAIGAVRSRPELGIFAQRAKDRPNPLGVSVVRLLAVEADGLRVRGLDAIDGTPVLDLKPHLPGFESPEGASVPGWVARLMSGYF